MLGLLGRGGMGVVYRAVDPLLDREVAIKVLPSHDDRSREHFTRNARVAATLRHPNIVTIYDVGEDQGQPFVAMEYVDGETLAQLIARRAPLSIPRRLEIVDQICDGLDYVHRAGVVHGDLKPANIAIAGDGTVKILDVGFSRLVSENTDAGMLVGTPRYLSPEQIEGRQIDARSDVFSVGLVVYETLAYTRAFPGDNIPDVLYRILRSEPPPLATVTPDVDPALDDAVQKAIRKDPSQRYQAMKELRADLARVRRRLASDTEEMPTTMPGAPAAAPSADPEIPTQQSRAAGRGRDEIARKRARHIEHYLEAARQHLDAGEFEQAMNESELAVMLDPDNGRANELLDRLRLAIEERQAHRTPPESPSPSPRRVDENVQFSVYRPPAMVPARWYTMLVFAHLATRRPDAPPDEPDPIDIVEQRAKVLLGSTAKRPITVDSLAGIPQEARLRVVPSVPGIELILPNTASSGCTPCTRWSSTSARTPPWREGLRAGRSPCIWACSRSHA